MTIRYMIQELLGKGTFGQVVKCVKKGTSVDFALKVIKNKEAYTKQAKNYEIKILNQLNKIETAETNKESLNLNETESTESKGHIIRLLDQFVFRNHVILVFELLDVSLYDLLRATSYNGFTLNIIRKLTEQILQGLIILELSNVIHCDLKPENILFVK